MGAIGEQIKRYADGNYDRWHTPGHKGTLNAYDVTEISDGNVFPHNAIDIAQKQIAKVYNGKYARLLTGGSSMGIKASLIATNVDVVTGINNHRAVEEGLRLAQKKAFYITNEIKDGLYMPITPQQADKALKQSGAGALVVLSPDYYGFTASKELVAVARENRALLIVDSAHGAHFVAHEQLKNKCFAQEADFINLSAHKTLNCYTQSAISIINNSEYIDKFDDALRLLGTTSPNYVAFAQTEDAVLELTNSLTEYERLRVAVNKLNNLGLVANDDFTRIVVDASFYHLDGCGLHDELYKRKIAVEKYDFRYVVLIATPYDDDKKFERLKNALCDIKKKSGKS